ncbi:pyridoxal-dependent decarboxylase [Rubneribacter badeniensis]|uniref:pyridoxal-dependent decarboxylase n=1 Tax=Rubneribacter badeniensis TaxID=2070688 RepID=UPI0013000934|nr:pyridoxal-dependent decarboxylase [Rubneribacter badeniensis]
MFTREQLEQLKTPCFVFDENELRGNFSSFTDALKDAWGDHARVSYSVKTNPFPWILAQAHACGCMAEVVSNDEYDLALSCGFCPEDIIFNGPVKGREWFAYALRNGSAVNIDSKRELRWVRELAVGSDAPLRVGVRVNVDLERFLPGETIGGDEPGRFGFSYESGEAVRVIRELDRIEGVSVTGLHMHVTTLGRLPRAYEILADHVCKVVKECELADQLDYVDMGGGFYGGGLRNAGKYEEYAHSIARALKEACDPARTALYVEPGGAVVCTPGYYVGRVVDVKDMGEKNVRFVVSELSRLNIDHEMKKTAYPYVLFSRSANVMPEQHLCGFTCMESDRLCTLLDEPELAEGDMVLIKYAGAYSMSFTPGFFIEHPPAVYGFVDGTFELLRDPFSGTPATA